MQCATIEFVSTRLRCKLRWMMSNVSIRQDPAGNVKPDKAKSTDRIDGVVAAIMAVGRGVLVAVEPGAWFI